MDIDRLLLDGSVAELRQGFESRTISVTEAVTFYLERINRLSGGRDGLNAVKSIAESAMDHARAADTALASGRNLGVLHGIPVLLKDNILTGDGLTASAGSGALQGFVPRREATLVKRLRDSGAIILGKTNLTDFADYVSGVMPSGFSTAGGIVTNPHNGPYGRGLGSSVGSAAAIAASLAPIAIGSETQNSIQTPACVSSIFGFKPSVGRVSRYGIIPLVPSQDSPGPLTRYAEDAALVVSVLAGADFRDTLSLGVDVARHGGAIREICNLRIGVPRRTIVDRSDLESALPVFERALSKLSRAGAQIIDPCDVPSAEQLRDLKSSVFPTEFKAALNTFLSDHEFPCGIDSLRSLIAWYESNADVNPYGHGLLAAAEETSGLLDESYRRDRIRDVILSRESGIHAALELGVDVLAVPMSVLAKSTGKAGTPVMAVPIGVDASDMPVGLTLIAGFGRDSALLAASIAIAQVVMEKRPVSLQ